MALVDGGKQRAISVDYPVYYSPGACLDILNGFMADAGDPALGGGGRRRGGLLRGAGATSRAARAASPEPPEGTRGPWEGAQNAPRGNSGRGGVSRAARTPRTPGRAARRGSPQAALGAVLPTGDFNPESKVSGKAGLRDGEGEEARSAARSRSAPGGSATPTPRRARHPLSPARSAHAPLLVNY